MSNEPIRSPINQVTLELLTEDGEPIPAPLHDSDKQYFHDVKVDPRVARGGEVNTRENAFRVAGQKRRNTRRENHG